MRFENKESKYIIEECYFTLQAAQRMLQVLITLGYTAIIKIN